MGFGLETPYLKNAPLFSPSQARSGSVPPPVAADLCEMLRCLGQFTAENTLKRLRFGIFGPAPGARESPNGEGLASFPPAHACAMLLLASVAAGADIGELAPCTSRYLTEGF